MVRHLVRPADRAEVQGVEALQLLEPVVRHHLAVLQVVVAAGPLEEFELEVDAMLLRRGLDHAHAFGKDFIADAVAGDCGDPECLAHAGHTHGGGRKEVQPCYKA
ncbi:hypothetical protein D3C76_1438460 [compost metagenome]